MKAVLSGWSELIGHYMETGMGTTCHTVEFGASFRQRRHFFMVSVIQVSHKRTGMGLSRGRSKDMCSKLYVMEHVTYSKHMFFREDPAQEEGGACRLHTG
jgi:hypothetical protein